MAITTVPFLAAPILAILATVAVGQTLRHPTEPEWSRLRLGVGLASYAAAAGSACGIDPSNVSDGLSRALERYSLTRPQLADLNGVIGEASVAAAAVPSPEDCARVRDAGERALRLLRPVVKRGNPRLSLTKGV